MRIKKSCDGSAAEEPELTEVERPEPKLAAQPSEAAPLQPVELEESPAPPVPSVPAPEKTVAKSEEVSGSAAETAPPEPAVTQTLSRGSRMTKTESLPERLSFEEEAVRCCKTLNKIGGQVVLDVVDRVTHEFVVLTPDYDVFVEQLDDSNSDLAAFHRSAPDGGPPAVVPLGAVYSFAPMTAADLAHYMSLGRGVGEAERRRRGIIAPAVPGAPAQQRWLLASMLEGHKIGEEVQPPVGHPALGDHGLMRLNDPDGSSHVVMIKRVCADDEASFCERQISLARIAEAVAGDDRLAADDLRTMSVKYAANGDRLRSFRDSVSEMVETEMEGFPYEPRTCLQYLQAIQSVAESSYAHHLAWVQQSRLPDGSRAAFEDETLSRILDTAIQFDSLQVCNLASFELLVRRKQLIADAHSLNPASPSYDGANYYLGTKFKPGGAIVVPTLTEHVSKKLQADSAILKERRKLEEAKGRGRGGGNKAPKTGNQQGAGGSSS
eukprot:s653_g17.t1